MHSRRATWACLLGAAVLLVSAMFVLQDQPTVNISASDLGDRGPAGRVACNIAPWDAGLNDNRQGPGGMHSGDFSAEVAAECYSANRTRFNAAVGCGVLALLMLGAGGVSRVRRTR